MATRPSIQRRRPAPLALALVLVASAAAAFAGCGSSGSSSSTASKSASATATGSKVSVAIVNFAFKPADITVKAGTKLTFTNHDSSAHTATTKTPGFDTGTLKPGQSATVTATKPGVYSYYCQFHAFMVAKVTVQ